MTCCLWGDCHASFATEIDCYYHVRDYHRPSLGGRNLERNKLCQWKATNSNGDVCGFFIRSNSHHPDHIISHFSSVLKPFTCEYCGFAFRSRQDRLKHVRVCFTANENKEVYQPPPLSNLTQTAINDTQTGFSVAFISRYVDILQRNGIMLSYADRSGLDSCMNRESRIPGIVLDNVHSHILQTSGHSLDSFIRLRNQIFYDHHRFLEGWIQREIQDVILRYPNWYKSIGIPILTQFWCVIKEHVCNQDRAILVNISSRSANKSYKTIALKISIVGQCDEQNLAIQKNSYVNSFHMLQIELDTVLPRIGLVGRFFTFNLIAPAEYKRNNFEGRQFGIEKYPELFGTDLFLCMRLGRWGQVFDIDGDMDFTGIKSRIAMLGPGL